VIETMSGLQVKPQANLHAAVVTDEAAFTELAQEWDSLLDQSDQCVYFLRWSWNHLWWRVFKPAGSSLFLITCRDAQNKLIGLAPFYLRQRRLVGIPHVRELSFLGTGVFAQTSEYLEIISRRGCERAVAEAVVGFLQNDRRWDRLWLNEMPASSLVLPFLHTALGDAVQIMPINRSHHIDTTVNWETFRQNLSRSTRKHLTRQMRRFAESYACEFNRVQDADQLPPALDALVQLHQARWNSKGEPGSFALPGVEELLREAARASLAQGRLRLWTLKLNGEIKAVRLAFLDNGIVHAFQGGFDPAYAKDSLGSVMLGLCIRDCLNDPDVREYDFMSGADVYKDWWAKSGRDIVTFVYLRSGLRPLVYTNLNRARDASRSVLRVVVPQSVRKAAFKMLERRHYAK
jgi:CelD/BcsL family acetyltransferase involved in cellulose biosynthesis